MPKRPTAKLKKSKMVSQPTVKTATKKPIKQIGWPALIISIVFCQAAGLIGSFFTYPAITAWYVFLNKPSFSPPNWLFGPVWLMLYTLMGVAFYLIWKKGEHKRAVQEALIIFIFHILINAFWSILFFGLRNPLLALFDIGFLLALIVILIRRFYQLEKIAAYLLVPYLFWVTFATILNFEVWRLN